MKSETQRKRAKSSHMAGARYINQNMSRYYTTSSAAPQLDYEEVERLPKKRKKPAPRKVIETNILHKMALIFSLAVVFMCCIIITMSYANLKNSQEGLLRVNNELRTLKAKNETLRAEINESVNLEEIQRIAMTELGMIEPEKYQIVNINVPRSSYTVVNEALTDRDDIGIIDSMRSLVRGVFDGRKQ